MNNHNLHHPHFQQLAHLLELESTAEQNQLQRRIRDIPSSNAERSGYTLSQLTIREVEEGLGGRVFVTLGKRNVEKMLPWTRLRNGSPIQMAEEDGKRSWRGVVSQLRRATIQVALSTWPEREEAPAIFRLDLAGDEIARQREVVALATADDARGNRLAELRNCLLGETTCTIPSPITILPIDPLLNKPQQQAVEHALAAVDVAMIHGPPGTGKTTAVIELIRQAIQRGERVLACAPSNLAVDNLLERLVAAPELPEGTVIRIGHPVRVLPQLRDHTLEFLVTGHEEMKLAQKLTKEAYALRMDAAKFTRAKPAPGERQAKRAEAKALLADARRLETQLVDRLVRKARVICSTLTGVDEQFLGEQMFDLCVIDEAAQSTEPSGWIPLRFCQRLVLAGDHQQLPPTVVSHEAERKGLGTSLMERLMAAQPALAKQLTLQYRMHEQIMRFSSQLFYANTLIADGSVQHHLLADLPQVAELVQCMVNFDRLE